MSNGWVVLAVGAVILAVLVADNVRTSRLRDVISLNGVAVVLMTAAVSTVVTGERGILVGSVAGAAALFAIAFAVEFARPGTLGFGTVKSCALLGAAAGSLGREPWTACAVALAVGVVLTGLLALRTPQRTLPTGPALAVGLCAAAVAGVVSGP